MNARKAVQCVVLSRYAARGGESIFSKVASTSTSMFDKEKFIDEVKKRPALYTHSRDEYHSKKDLRIELWNEIGKEMYDDWDEKSNEEKSNLGRCRCVPFESSVELPFFWYLKCSVNFDFVDLYFGYLTFRQYPLKTTIIVS